MKKGFADESEIMDGRLKNLNQAHDKKTELMKK